MVEEDKEAGRSLLVRMPMIYAGGWLGCGCGGGSIVDRRLRSKKQEAAACAFLRSLKRKIFDFFVILPYIHMHTKFSLFFTLLPKVPIMKKSSS